MWLQLLSSYHNLSIAAVQQCITSRPVTYPYWNEPHIGEKAVETWWPASIAETSLRQWTKDSDHCPSWHRTETSCLRKSEERWGTSLVGYLIQMVSNSDRNTEPDFTPHCDSVDLHYIMLTVKHFHIHYSAEVRWTINIATKPYLRL